MYQSFVRALAAQGCIDAATGVPKNYITPQQQALPALSSLSPFEVSQVNIQATNEALKMADLGSVYFAVEDLATKHPVDEMLLWFRDQDHACASDEDVFANRGHWWGRTENGYEAAWNGEQHLLLSLYQQLGPMKLRLEKRAKFAEEVKARGGILVGDGACVPS
jgi:hypothetical protein